MGTPCPTCPLPTSTPRVYNQTPPVCFGVLGEFPPPTISWVSGHIGIRSKADSRDFLTLRIFLLLTPKLLVIWAEKPLRSYNAFGWWLSGYIPKSLEFFVTTKMQRYIYRTNKSKHIYIYKYINALQIKMHTYLIYTQKNMWQHIRYQQVKHGSKNRCTIAKPEVFGWTLVGGKSFTSDPPLCCWWFKLWKNLLKLGSEYPTLCRLLYLTGG